MTGYQGDPDLLTLRQAAVYLDVSAPTAYRLAKAGQFPGAMKIGRSWRVSKPRLLNHLHGVPLQVTDQPRAAASCSGAP